MKRMNKNSELKTKRASMVQWFNVGRLLMLFIAILLISPTKSNALSEGKISFLTFSSYIVEADSTLNVGDTIKVQFNVTSLQRDSSTIYFHTSKGLHILNNDSVFYQSRIYTDTNSAQNTEIRVIIDSLKNCFYELFVLSDFNTGQYSSSISKLGNLQNNGFNSLILSDPYDNDDLTISTMQYAEPTCLNQNNHHIKITGKVSFLDWNEPKTFYANGNTLEHFPRRKSPRTTAWIFFRTNDQPNQFSHPIKFNQITGKPIKGIHYVECVEGTNFNEESGEFIFEFDYNPLSLYCQAYENMTVEIYIAKENEATLLNSGSDHIIVSNYPNLFNTTNELKLYPTKYFSITYPNGVPQNIDISYITTPELNIELPFDEGAMFRYMTISREFLKDLYNNNNLEFSENRKLEQCNSNLLWRAHTGSDPGGQYFFNSKNIDIYKYYNGNDHNYTNCKVIAHEYGHYFDHILTNCGHNEIEGFAMFFSYAANVWMRNSFGDFFGIDDDCEIGPFCKYYVNDDIHIINKDEPNEVSYNRYGNITKLGVPDINSCRFACYLWNIYDSKSDQPFSPINDWDGMANDDVEDLREDLMDFWIELPLDGVNFSGFNDSFKNKYSANVRLQSSIQAVYNFMDFRSSNDYSNPLIENITARMRSPNIQSMSYTTNVINNQIYVKFLWGDDISYKNIPFESIYKDTKYVYPFQNTPQSIRLSHNYTNSDEWQVYETIENYINVKESEWYLTNNEIPYDKFKLSTLNTNAEESYQPLIVNFGIPMAKIAYNDLEVSDISLNLTTYKIENLLTISSLDKIDIKMIRFYNIEGKIVNEIAINDGFSLYHSIDLSNTVHNISSQSLFMQIIFTDRNYKLHFINYKLIK